MGSLSLYNLWGLVVLPCSSQHSCHASPQDPLFPNSIHAPSTLQSQDRPRFSCSPRAVAVSPSVPQIPHLTEISARSVRQLWTKMKEVTVQHLIKIIIGNTRANFSALLSPGNAAAGVHTPPLALALSFKAALSKLEKIKSSTITRFRKLIYM